LSVLVPAITSNMAVWVNNYKGMLNAQFLKAPFVNKPVDKIKRFEFEDW